jgi:hypothetical protein
LDEGILWFKTEEDFTAWVKANGVLGYVFSDDGLLAGWRRFPMRKQLNVDLWRVMIAGKKPSRLPGSQNEAITVTGGRPGK